MDLDEMLALMAATIYANMPAGTRTREECMDAAVEHAEKLWTRVIRRGKNGR
jgi:hypothetical protein